MKYVHPDVLDNGPAHLRINATRALLLPDFVETQTYAQIVASALASATISPIDFTLSDDGTGRKVVFGGATMAASKSLLGGQPLHIALTDGSARILMVDAESSHPPIVVGQTYSIPTMTYSVKQPQ